MVGTRHVFEGPSAMRGAMWVGDFWLCGSVGWLPLRAGMKGKSHWKEMFVLPFGSLIPSLVCTYVLCQPHDKSP